MGFPKFFNRKKKKQKKNNKKKKNSQSKSIVKTTPLSSPDSRTRIEQELTHVFKKFDVNGDGKISSSELGSIMGALGQSPTEDELVHMITEVDADGDGFIDLNEFIELNTKGIDSDDLIENLKDAFSVFDLDKNGGITAEELMKVLGSLGEECDIGECRKMIAGVDQDGDVMISFEEFKVMMMMMGV